MAKEILAIPEACLREVVAVILNGLDCDIDISDETRQQLKKWCDEELDYQDN